MKPLLVFGILLASCLAEHFEDVHRHTVVAKNSGTALRLALLPTAGPVPSTTTTTPDPPTTMLAPAIPTNATTTQGSTTSATKAPVGVNDVTTTKSPAQVTTEPRQAQDFREGLRQFILARRNALNTFEVDTSKDNLGPWMRSLTTDFDTLEYAHKGKDGSIKAKYKVMLKNTTTIRKLENLLFLTRDEGSRYCSDNFDNGTLLTIHTAAESADIVDWLFYKLRVPAKVWLGATKVRRVEERSGYYDRRGMYVQPTYAKPMWLWDDNQGLAGFTNWHTTGSVSTTTNSVYYSGYNSGRCEPSDTNGNENCIEMLSHYYPYPTVCNTEAVAGNWNDIQCSNNIKNVIVCKKAMT